MKDNLKDALKNIASRIDVLIAEDTFPNTVYPECLRNAVRTYPVRGGKRLRPALLLWACQALGGTEEQALYAAAAAEVFHSWTLVHDDIIDEDEVRRGKPTQHIELANYANKQYTRSQESCTKFGHDFAILAGDIQQGWANDLLLRGAGKNFSAEVTLALVNYLQKVVNRELISGEALDVELPMRDWSAVSEKDVLKVIDGKTVCLLKFCVVAGGIIGLGKPDWQDPKIKALEKYADGLGTAFQLRDDYLGVFGSFETFGKPLCSDFQEGKPTLLFLDAMKSLPEGKRVELLSLTALPEYPDTLVQKIRGLLTECGAAQRLQIKIENYTQQALTSLAILPDSPWKQLLLDLAEYLLARAV